MFRTFSLMVMTAAVVGLAGCQCCQRRPVAPRTTVVPGQPCPPGGVTVPQPPAPLGGGPSVNVMPPNFPGPGAVPGITPQPPGGATVVPPPPNPPTVTPPQTSQLAPRLEPNWQPAEARGVAPQIAQAGTDPLVGTQPGSAAPRPLPQGPATPSAPRLYPPENQEQSTAEPPLLQEKNPPRVSEQSPASLPVGIAQFVPSVLQVAGVSAGLRPKIDDGLDWLAKNRYKTVLHLRVPEKIS